MTACYNEHDPFAAAWLRNLIDAGLIAPGVVDERSIKDVQPDDLQGFKQCHFFAGIGGWSYALRLAGWPDDRPVWTGSCPCQPFSSAGKGLGEDDPRHLWPDFYRLIRECRPATVFGEQVAQSAGRRWLDGVFADLEASDYACGAADIAAAGVGAPHIRQRLFWVADATHADRRAGEQGEQGEAWRGGCGLADGGVECRGLVHANGGGVLGDQRGQDAGPPSSVATEARQQRIRHDAEPAGVVDGLGHALRPRPQGRAEHGGDGDQPKRHDAVATRPAPATSWDDFDLVRCVEPTKESGRFVEKRRRVEPGTRPLAHGIPARVGRLRGYGNAIVPQVAAEFIAAYLEVKRDRTPRE